MARKRVKTDDMEVNYKFACRCCLKSEAEFFKLDSLTETVIGGNNESSTKIPLIRLLLFCMRTENLPELPQYICVECSKSLQIAYFFIQNGLRAHEILCRKLCPGKLKSTPRFNGQQQQQLFEDNRDDATIVTLKAKSPKSALRHECKVCGAIIYNRVELKQHIRMHTEESKHTCKLCKFVTLKQRLLSEHYRRAHGLTAAQIDQQLKLRRSMQAAATATNVTTSAAAAARTVDDNQVKVCTLEDMELLIPTVLRPEDFSQPQLDSEQLRDIEKQLSNSLAVDQSVVMPSEPTIASGESGNVSIGAQFLVMPDGSLQQVDDGGVVFEYIDDSKRATTTTNTTLQNLLDDSMPDVSYNAMDIDVNHMVTDALPQITVKPPTRSGPGITATLKHKCKLCPKAFPTVARLKSHQLTHSHLPKFYCDQCSYYSLRSADLIQHYMEDHNTSIGESKSQLEKSSLSTTDRSRIYSCDLCLFDTPSSVQLRKHYSDKHLMQPSEVQLRPSWNHESKDKGGRTTLVSDQNQLRNSQPAVSHIPLGIKYSTTSAVATDELRATNESSATTAMHVQQQAQPTTTAVVTATGDINVVVDATTMFYAATAASTSEEATATTTTTASIATELNEFAMFPEQSFANSMTTTTLTREASGMLPAVNSAAVAHTGNPNCSIFGDMQDFIDDTDVAAVCTIPADDMPVVDGDDIVIDNNNMSLDFDAENLFEDFEEDVEVGEDDDEDEEDAENDDENDNNDAAADQNLLLTSDDDDVDDFDDEQSKHLQKPYCIYCNKKFTSQYKFENHMFVHRGLAPYRCELCTNLYNMKRLLIRHYKTVHKRMPTRDMVQAKGDKILVERTAIEKLNTNFEKPPMLMCAKCPFECEQEAEMRKHLNAHHGINDGVSVHANEVFIIRKLPFECPRCIRSFAAKRTLTRHLQRSHLVDTIIEMQAPQLTTSSAATTTTSTATTTLPKNDSDGCGDNKATFMDHLRQRDFGNAGGDVDVDGDGDGDGNGKCEDRAINSDTGIETDNEDIDTKPSTTRSGIETTTAAKANDNVKQTNTDEEASPNVTTSTARSELSTSLTTSAIAETSAKTPTTTVDSTLFPTPTNFDFDLDFIGNGSLKNSNESLNIISSTRQLLNGSDKLLTAALEPSPVKDLRPRLPRTPIYVCKQCNQTFDELGKLLQHELEQHSNGTALLRRNHQHKCNICSSSYRTVTLLNYHMNRHAPRKVQCKQCTKEFTSNSELEEHVESEHVVSEYVDSKHVQSEHVVSEQGKKEPMICGIDGCTKTYNYKHHLKRHQTASHTPVRYVCTQCGRDMLTSLNLRHHMYSHKSSHSYKCPKCVRTYIRGNSFKSHALREHKWSPTDSEMAKIYCLNVTPPSMQYGIRELRSVNADNEHSD
ncbi:hypothetical protein ACLKA6_015611 [Drosophila palustris]